ncbi:hypothetical protein B0T24DRAFT_725084 [Lasiosphaeria ovina]|uniref:Uncharacterized protein n=1 Tax=Lasiosphaeria ovina TaxID=92902 RepID=A0AAE0JT23_9PEZI|nr:hypothetical protein B0T24DRAFT_725084 [Lasiosphaeria ovina]
MLALPIPLLVPVLTTIFSTLRGARGRTRSEDAAKCLDLPLAAGFRFGVFVALTDATGLRMIQRRYQEQPAAEGHQMVVMPLPDVDFPARVALFYRNLPTLLEPLRVVVLRADDVDIIFADIEAALFALHRRRPVFIVGYWAPTPVGGMFVF